MIGYLLKINYNSAKSGEFLLENLQKAREKRQKMVDSLSGEEENEGKCARCRYFTCEGYRNEEIPAFLKNFFKKAGRFVT